MSYTEPSRIYIDNATHGCPLCGMTTCTGEKTTRQPGEYIMYSCTCIIASHVPERHGIYGNAPCCGKQKRKAAREQGKAMHTSQQLLTCRAARSMALANLIMDTACCLPRSDPWAFFESSTHENPARGTTSRCHNTW